MNKAYKYRVMPFVFEDNQIEEIKAMLQQVINKLYNAKCDKIYDSNGNHIGAYQFKYGMYNAKR